MPSIFARPSRLLGQSDASVIAPNGVDLTACEKNLIDWERSIPELQPATQVALKIIKIASNAKSQKNNCSEIAEQVYSLIDGARRGIEERPEPASSAQAVKGIVGFLERIEDRLRVFKSRIPLTSHIEERIAECRKHAESAHHALQIIYENHAVAEHPPTSATVPEQPHAAHSTAGLILSEESQSHPARKVLKNTLKSALIVAEKAVSGIPVPGLQGALGALNEIIRMAEETSSNTDGLQELKHRITYLEHAMGGQELRPSAEEIIERLLRRVTDIKNQLEDYRERGKVASFFNSKDDAGFLNDCNQALNRLLLDFQAITQIDNASGIAELKKFMLTKDEDDRFGGMPWVMTAAYNSQARATASGCMEGTRVQVLESVRTWLSHGEEPILWVPGLAGTGKTTISHTVAEECDKRGILGGSFFFSRYEKDRREARHVFSTIAFQIGNRYPQLKSAIADVMKDKTIVGQAFQHHLQKLIVKPLVDLKLGRFPPIVVVLDALDECEDDIIELFINILTNDWDGIGTPLKFFLTSRPDRRLQTAYSEPGVKGKKLVLHEVQLPDVQADIHKYFNHQLASIAKHHSDILEPGQWPSEDSVQLLVNKASGLFIYASTVLNFIGSTKGDPSERLQVVLSTASSTTPEDPYSRLDSLYTQILAEAGHENFQEIVGTIVFLAQRLSIRDLSDLIGLTRSNITICLRPLHSVILVPENVDGGVQAYHLSFRDYLTDNTRCKNPDFFVDPTPRQRKLALLCLARMKRSLKKDICEIGDPSKWNSEVEDMEMRRATHLPPALQYAILHWSTHIVHISPDTEVLEKLEAFFSKHTLHWIEALSIIGRVEDGITAIREVSQWLLGSVVHDTLQQLLHDTERMMLAFLVPITASALQTYDSGYAFMPKGTTLYQTLQNQGGRSSIQVLSGIREGWDECLATLEGHRGFVDPIACSPDGEEIVSCSGDTNLRVWDARSGVCSHVLEGHTEFLLSAVFLPDGSKVVSCSIDKTLRIWDIKLGSCSHLLEGHTESVNAVAVSPDGGKIVSGSTDKTVRLWDAKSGVSLHVLAGHTEIVNSVAFSPDGGRIVSGSFDKTIRVWDAKSGAALYVLKGHTDSVKYVVFSPNAKRLLSCSADNTLRIWDTRSKACVRVLEGHTGYVNMAIFSRDGDRIVSCSLDSSPRVWDAKSGACLLVLEGHTGTVKVVGFSPDEDRIVSCSGDKTVRVWDAKSGASLHVLRGHTEYINLAMFSPDGEKVFSCANDKTVRVWDVKSDAYSRIPDGHDGTVYLLAFSPDGDKVVSCSKDKTLRVWDASSGACSHVMKGHTEYINSLAFSPGGEKLISSSFDKTLRVWDVMSGACSHVLDGHTKYVNSFAFSHDGKKIISCSFDQTLRVWDIKSGACLRVMKGHTDWVSSFATSSDGENIVSCSWDTTLRIWDVASGACAQVLEGHTGYINAATFSRDGNNIASCSFDKTLRIWDAKSGVCLRALEGHAGLIKLVAFSHEGEKIVSCSWDKTIRVWGTKSGTCSRVFDIDSPESVKSIAFSPNGEKVIAYTDSGETVYTLDAGSDSPLQADSDEMDWIDLPSLTCSFENKWLYVKENGKSQPRRVCWIPDIPTRGEASWDYCVAGCGSGRVFIIDISSLF